MEHLYQIKESDINSEDAKTMDKLVRYIIQKTVKN